MAIALAEQILNADDRITEKSLLEQLHEILLNTKPIQKCNDIKNCELKSKHRKQLFATLPSKNIEIHTHQRTSISTFLNFDSHVICHFLCWVFERQYGWTEKCPTDFNYNNRLSINSGIEMKTLCENFIVW